LFKAAVVGILQKCHNMLAARICAKNRNHTAIKSRMDP
jgi:hypothetical protein